jgi:hypothetical protein
VGIVYAGNKLHEAFAALERDDLAGARRNATDSVRDLEAITPKGGSQKFLKVLILRYGNDLVGEAEYRLGDFVAAEGAMARAVDQRKAIGADAIGDRRDLNGLLTWLAMIQARQGHRDEAAGTIAPAVKFERELAARNHGDQWVPFELGCALYAQALAEPGQRAALLREAAALMNGLTPEIGALHDTQRWRKWIQQAQQGQLTGRTSQAARSAG